MLLVKPSPGKGRGVFAGRDFLAGETFEFSPVIVIPENELVGIRRTVLSNYFFKWGKDGAFALGVGSLFNHSYEPNATFTILIDRQEIEFKAIKEIAAGEEITINYNGDPHDRSRLWFKVDET
jgi:SET domain-containing protein